MSPINATDCHFLSRGIVVDTLDKLWFLFSILEFQPVFGFSRNSFILVLGANLRHKEALHREILLSDFVYNIKETICRVLKIIEMIGDVNKETRNPQFFKQGATFIAKFRVIGRNKMYFLTKYSCRDNFLDYNLISNLDRYSISLVC